MAAMAQRSWPPSLIRSRAAGAMSWPAEGALAPSWDAHPVRAVMASAPLTRNAAERVAAPGRLGSGCISASTSGAGRLSRLAVYVVDHIYRATEVGGVGGARTT